MPQPAALPPWMVAGDYRRAVLHLASLVTGGLWSPVFALVELFPAEFADPDITAELTGPTFKVGKQMCRTYLKRLHLSVEEALRWYGASRAGRAQAVGEKNRDGTDVYYAVGELAQEPEWPTVCAANDLPFLSQAWGIVRSHHLVQTENPANVAALLKCEHKESWTDCGHKKSRKWFSDHLFWDLAAHPEWIGSISLVAPNPLYRGLEWHLNELAGSHPVTVIRAIARAGKPLDSLKIHVEEYGPIGFIATHDRVGMNDPLTVRHSSPEGVLSYVVTCSQRGPLDCSEPRRVTSGPMGLHVNAGPQIAMQRIEVPGTPRQPAETIELPLIQTSLDSDIGRPPQAGLASDFLWKTLRMAYLRGLRQEKWFYQDPQAAREFVQGVIAGAQYRVWIIDPYFGVVELFRYAMGTTRTNVQTRLLIGGTRLREDDPTEPSREAGESLLKQLRRHAQRKPVTARVMRNDLAIHDRFLVIDDSVWLSGSSFHSLGGRASMVVQILDAEPIIGELDAIMNDEAHTLSLEEWVEQRREIQSVPNWCV